MERSVEIDTPCPNCGAEHVIVVEIAGVDAAKIEAALAKLKKQRGR